MLKERIKKEWNGRGMAGDFSAQIGLFDAFTAASNDT